MVLPFSVDFISPLPTLNHRPGGIELNPDGQDSLRVEHLPSDIGLVQVSCLCRPCTTQTPDPGLGNLDRESRLRYCLIGTQNVRH